MELALSQENVVTADAEETTEKEVTAEETDNAPSSADRFYNAVREMKSRQHVRERELVELMAKKLNVSGKDYEGIKARLTDKEAEEKETDDFSARLEGWQKREAEVQKLYPGFVLAEELRDRDFFNLCYNGVDILTAYQVLHLDDIIMSAMSYAISELKRAGITNQSSSSRAREGALDSAGRTRQDKPKLTKKERNELIRRAERGETVRL